MVIVRNLENVKITGFEISFKTLWCLEKIGYFQEFVFLPVFKQNQILLCSWLECTAELTSETFDLLIKHVILPDFKNWCRRQINDVIGYKSVISRATFKYPSTPGHLSGAVFSPLSRDVPNRKIQARTKFEKWKIRKKPVKLPVIVDDIDQSCSWNWASKCFLIGHLIS